MRIILIIFGVFLVSLNNVKSQIIEVSCDEPVMVYNNHVGNEWHHIFKVNGIKYFIDQPLIIDLLSAPKVVFETWEEHEKFPDHASQSIGIDPAKMELNKLYSKQLELIVRESNGRYAGNTAMWRVTIYYKKTISKT